MGITKGIYRRKEDGYYYLCRNIMLMAQSDLSESMIHYAVLIEKLDQQSLMVTGNPEANQTVLTNTFFDGHYVKATGGIFNEVFRTQS